MKAKLFFLKLFLSSKRRFTNARIRLCGAKGREYFINRETKPKIQTYLYYPQKCDKNKKPLVINVHGGAWVMGDALVLDTQSQMIADALSALVVNVNYKKADEKPFPYSQYEIFDTVTHSIDRADEYGIDTEKIVLMGYSAGAHLCACCAQMLRDKGIKVHTQMLCYPFTDFTCDNGKQVELQKTLDSIDFLDEVLFAEIEKGNYLSSPGQNTDLSGLPFTIIITCTGDSLKVQGDAYAKRLIECGIEVEHINYEGALHGFMEVNYPETKKDGAKSAEQEILCKKCLDDILSIMKNRL